jgi:hypothetical protein
MINWLYEPVAGTQMNWLSDLATITAGIVAAAAVIGFVYSTYRRTFGRKWDHYHRLARLGTNAQVSFFSSVLGQPPAMRRRRTLQLGGSTGSQIKPFDYLWADRDYFVAALADGDESILAFAVTTRSKSFRPRFRSARGKVHPILEVHLARTRFCDLESRPVAIQSTLGARRVGYREIYYLGNPGAYLYYGCGINDAGAYEWTGIDPKLGNLNHTPGGAPDPILDEELQAFRERSRINTCLLSWPDHDQVRTFT